MPRFLRNEPRIPLVCVGRQQACTTLKTDEQLMRHFEAVALPPWGIDQNFAELIGSLQRALPMRRESKIGKRTLKSILETTNGVPAAIFSLMTRLAVAGIVNGETRVMGSDFEDAKTTSSLLGEAVCRAARFAVACRAATGGRGAAVVMTIPGPGDLRHVSEYAARPLRTHWIFALTLERRLRRSRGP
jgi:hypothetical protein